MTKQIRSKINYKYLLLSLICVISLIPFVIASFYSRPSADDFDYSYPLFHMIQNGNKNIFSLLKASFDMMRYYYINWQGTYSSAILMSLQTGIWGDEYYFLGTFILMIFMYVCLYRFIYILNKRILGNSMPTYFLALLFLTVFLQTCPYLVQCLYWQCGAYHYIPFFFLTLVVISYEIEYYCSKDRKEKNKSIVIASILSFIISGGNQVTSFLNMLIMCLFILYAFYKKMDKGLFIPLIVGIVGFLIMFFAPGNSVRLDNTVQTSIFAAIFNSFKGTAKYLLKWPNVGWIAFVIIIVILLIPIISNFNYKLTINPLIVIVVSYLLFAAMFCPTNYAMSTNGPGRLKNVIYFALVIFSVIDVIYLLIWLKQKNNFEIKIKDNYRNLLVLVLLIVMCFYKNNNNIMVINEYKTGILQNFANKYDERVEIVTNSKDEIVYVDPLPECKTLNFDDITKDVNDCRNIWWQEYYGVVTLIK